MEKRVTVNSNTITINQLAEWNWGWCERMGWHNKFPLEYVALICSEIGEVANECRGDEPTPELGSELADIILRTVDMAKQFNIDIAKECVNKMVLNEKRGTRGRKK